MKNKTLFQYMDAWTAILDPGQFMLRENGVWEGGLVVQVNRFVALYTIDSERKLRNERFSNR